MAGIVVFFKGVDQAPIHYPNAAQVVDGTGVKYIKNEQGDETYHTIVDEIYAGFMIEGQGTFWPPEA